jgi:hypothetical protein
MGAPLVGAPDLAELLEIEPEALSASEAQAIVADFLARAADPPRPCAGARACRCPRPWKWEDAHCGKCGHDLEGRAA